jgi:phosphoenolpyruvate carboxykinase (ATP)
VWFENGLFNIEGGCYAKVDKLSKEQEPEIFGAIKFGSVLENVVLDSMTHEVDFNDLTITENTRASYPIEYIPNARIPCVGGHPKNIILLTCDAFGVLPPVSRLTPLQTQYHFITGYTAKVAGTEIGVTEPKATFSSCFGEAFIVHHPAKVSVDALCCVCLLLFVVLVWFSNERRSLTTTYHLPHHLPHQPPQYADLLAKLMEKHSANAWLVNTGWVGGGYGVGSRIKLKYTRAMLDAIHDGSLLTAEYKAMDNFGLQIPLTCKGVPDEVLFPRQAWKDQAKYDQTLKKLAEMFVKNFDKYKAGVSPQVVEAGPKL